jgi:hypothetical protein
MTKIILHGLHEAYYDKKYIDSVLGSRMNCTMI